MIDVLENIVLSWDDGIALEESSIVDNIDLLKEFCCGNFVGVITKYDVIDWKDFIDLLIFEEDSLISLKRKLEKSILALSDVSEKNSFPIFNLLVFGISCLELYCQANFTGPELSRQDTETIHAAADESKIHNISLQLLECDGHYPYPICQIPHTLLISRLILHTLAECDKKIWKEGFELDASGNIIRAQELDESASIFHESTRQFQSLSWWCARAAVVHARLLQDCRYETIPTLWNECKDLFAKALSAYGTFPRINLPEKSTFEINGQPHEGEAYEHHPPPTNILLAKLNLEWGLCMHHFSFGDKVIPRPLLWTSSISLCI